MDSIMMRFRDKFIDEAQKLLDNMENTLLGLESNPTDKELIDSAFRVMHTLKGVSGMYGFNHVSEFTHHFESIYQAIREGQKGFNKIIFDITFSSIDHIRNLLNDEDLVNPANINEHERLIGILKNQISQDECNSPISKPLSINERPDATWHILMRTTELQFFRGISFLSIFKELANLGEFTIFKLNEQQQGENDSWSIYLYSQATEDEIREVFMFIEDDCIINHIHKGNIISNDHQVNPLFNIQTENTLNNEYFYSNEVESDTSILINNTPLSLSNPKDTNLNISDEKKKSAPVEKIKELVKDLNNSFINEKSITKRISVDSQKLDNLMFLVSELITVNSQLLISSNNPKHFDLKPLFEKVDNLSKQFRNNALEIRLVPISDSFIRFQRLIRDLSKLLNKKVEFITQGADTELDKNIIDQLADPLMHLIRNCIDHGIESPDERIAKGKPETGTIKLTATNNGNFIFLTVEDDGDGINTDSIRKKALEKGFISALDKLTEKEAIDLIFHPGFSTAQNLTEVSGRGVGMDVVKKRITELRGEIMVDSQKGQGTRFTLKLQQSLSIVDSLLFQVGDNRFTIPVCDIEICEQVKASDIEANRHTSTLPYRNELIYFTDLRQLLNIGGTYESNARMIIMNNGNNRIALIVDKIIGEHQAVLKPLGKSFNQQQYLTSASQLGDGNIAFMLDITAVIKNASEKAA